MKTRKYDWTTIQDFYDQGHTWKEVTKKFGAYSLTIQRAIKRGDLTTRKCGNRRVHNEQMATCMECQKDYSYKQGAALGMFCSTVCCHEYKWKNQTIPRMLLGKASAAVIKKYLMKVDGKCNICHLGNEWQGKPIVIQLDHIDGNSDNNTLDNTRLLCPNCHSQTSTFGSKNKGQIATRNLQMKQQRLKRAVSSKEERLNDIQEVVIS